MVRKMKKEHMQHHYKNGTVGFGVTNKFWDTVFDTLVTEDSIKYKKVWDRIIDNLWTIVIQVIIILLFIKLTIKTRS